MLECASRYCDARKKNRSARQTHNIIVVNGACAADNLNRALACKNRMQKKHESHAEHANFNYTLAGWLEGSTTLGGRPDTRRTRRTLSSQNTGGRASQPPPPQSPPGDTRAEHAALTFGRGTRRQAAIVRIFRQASVRPARSLGLMARPKPPL